VSLHIERQTINVEALLASGSLVSSEVSGLTEGQTAEVAQYWVGIGFDLRMLGRMIGKRIVVTQINRRAKNGDLLGTRWEVKVRGKHADANPSS
jgi:hypothetical protein